MASRRGLVEGIVFVQDGALHTTRVVGLWRGAVSRLSRSWNLIEMRRHIDKREERIRGMFGEIAPRYDLLNHLLSLNVDHYWRWRTTRLVPPRNLSPILDMCTGTGDLALAYDKAAKGKVPIVGADFCHQMLERAIVKIERKNASDRIRFLEADAQHLPFPNDHFQIATVAFGLRNVTDTDRGIAEMVRVTQPGGRSRSWSFRSRVAGCSSGCSRFISAGSCRSLAKSFRGAVRARINTCRKACRSSTTATPSRHACGGMA